MVAESYGELAESITAFAVFARSPESTDPGLEMPRLYLPCSHRTTTTTTTTTTHQHTRCTQHGHMLHTQRHGTPGSTHTRVQMWNNIVGVVQRPT